MKKIMLFNRINGKPQLSKMYHTGLVEYRNCQEELG
jgi:hypothetical protein